MTPSLLLMDQSPTLTPPPAMEDTLTTQDNPRPLQDQELLPKPPRRPPATEVTLPTRPKSPLTDQETLSPKRPPLPQEEESQRALTTPPDHQMEESSHTSLELQSTEDKQLQLCSPPPALNTFQYLPQSPTPKEDTLPTHMFPPQTDSRPSLKPPFPPDLAP